MTEAGPVSRRVSFRRGAPILPSTFTAMNLLFGFWSIVSANQHRYREAALLIFAAGVMDLLDGRIARLTGTTSEFGAELDSLADVISFGVAPGFLAFSWGFAGAPRGWLAAFLFVVCGALRLARFNVQKHVVDSRYFVGMPIPAAAGQIAALVHFSPQPFSGRSEALLVMALVVSLAFLMVSTFRYPSFKGLDLKKRRSYINILPIAIAIVVIGLNPHYVLITLTTLYSVWPPAAYAVSLMFRRGTPPAAPVTAPQAP